MNRLKRLSKTLRSNYWNIGFVEDDIRDVLKSERLNIHWLNHPYKDRWFADPYFLSVNDEYITLLVEEFSYKLQKGRIAKLVIKRDGYQLEDMKIILELPTHLSFPVIYRKGDSTFIMPENSKSGKTTIYQYDDKTDELKEVKALCHLPLTDATLAEMPDGKQYVLSTKEPTQNDNHLQIYPVDTDSWTMTEQPVQNVCFDSKVARNAGDVFVVDDIMYRPAQDCNKGYGNGVNIQQMDYKGGQFCFKDVRTFFSDIPEFDMGYHTFNIMNGLIVVDAHGHRFKTGNKIMMGLLSIYASLRGIK